MKRLTQFFRNVKMPVKLMISYALVVAVAIIGIGILLYSFVRRQVRTQYAQIADSAVQMAEGTLQERCVRAERSAEYLMTDLNVIQIVNATNYVSEYQKSYDVNQILDPTVVNVSEQNNIIDQIVFFTYGDIRTLREGYLDITQSSDSPWLTRSETPLWKCVDGEIGLCGGIVNIWQPEHTATMVMILDREQLFEKLLPEIEYDCALQVTDADGTLLYSAERVTDAENWAKDTAREVFTATVGINGWIISFECSDAKLSGASSELFTLLTVVTAVMVLLMAAVAVVFSVSISSRVTKLCDEVSAVVENDYRSDIHSEDKDEIGIISNTVGGMITQTREMIQEKYQGELDRKNAQVKALQTQINPHFLYNTLSNLNWRAIAREDMEMSKILTDLSQFYRLSLNGGSVISTIGQELDHVKTYVRIQCAIRQAQLKEETYAVDEELLDYRVPGIILQPIVENALGHGIGAIGYENGILRVCVGMENERIVIRVSDNGPGVSAEIAEHIFDADSKIGYGLRNVNQRLQLLFGAHSMMYFAQQTSGSTVVLELPPLSDNPAWLSGDAKN